MVAVGLFLLAMGFACFLPRPAFRLPRSGQGEERLPSLRGGAVRARDALLAERTISKMAPGARGPRSISREFRIVGGCCCRGNSGAQGPGLKRPQLGPGGGGRVSKTGFSVFAPPRRTAARHHAMEERANLMNMMKLSIKTLIQSALSLGRTLDSDFPPLQQFFVVLEHCLKHGLKGGLVRPCAEGRPAVTLVALCPAVSAVGCVVLCRLSERPVAVCPLSCPLVRDAGVWVRLGGCRFSSRTSLCAPCSKEDLYWTEQIVLWSFGAGGKALS